MSPQIVNALELIMLMVSIVSRYAATCIIVFFLIQSDISNGWKVLLILLSVLFGFELHLKYKNPNAKTKDENDGGLVQH